MNQEIIYTIPAIDNRKSKITQQPHLHQIKPIKKAEMMRDFLCLKNRKKAMVIIMPIKKLIRLQNKRRTPSVLLNKTL